MIEKMNPFKQIIEAMKAFTYTDIFYKLRKQSTGSKFLVALLTSVIACFFTFILGGYKLAHNSVWEELIGLIPEFIYVNGQLVCEDKYDQAVAGGSDIYVVMDTDVDAWIIPQPGSTIQGVDITNKVTSIISNYPEVEQILFISRRNYVVIRGIGVQTTYQDLEWSQLFDVFGIQSLTKSDIQSGYKGVIMKIASILFFGALPFRMIGLFFITLLLTMVALIINALHKANEDFTTLYWITFYIQSAFMMIIALLKVFITWKTGITVIVCLVYYIVTMERVLKNGTPVESVPVGNSGAATDFGVIEDDFDRFMEKTADVRPLQETSAFDLYAEQKEETHDPVLQNGGLSFRIEEEEGKESTGKTSGLSLKQDD